MNNLLKHTLQNPMQKRSTCSAEQRIQDYLDSLGSPLTGILPADQCREVRMEAEGHLHALIAELRADGLPVEAATEAALQAYGDPQPLGRAIARNWNAGRPLRRRNVAGLAAFLCVSLMMFESGAVLELFAFDPSGSGTPLGVLLIGLVALAVLTGCVTAILVPFRSATALLKMASVWLLYAFAGGFAMPPHQHGLGTALFLLCFSLPFSGLTARYISARLGRRVPASISPLSMR